jgi:YYY domain-containing protein
LNGILRSPTFPPLNPHFAGGVINYYYFGLYLVAYLIKLSGIYAEVAFNLTIATLFALTVANSFAVVYSAARSRPETPEPETPELETAGPETGEPETRVRPPATPWQRGLAAALLGPLFVTLIGNLDGFAQVVRSLANVAPGSFQSTLPGLKALVDAGAGLQQVIAGTASLPPYDFWGPSRVIPPTINEFPFWSFLFADLHPHIIGIPLAGLFLAFALVLIERGGTDWRARWGYGVALLASFALLLGAMAAVNLWELPTYLGLGVLAFLISQFRGHGRINWWLSAFVTLLYAGGAYLLFAPFFRTYVNVGASGVGLVRAPDAPELWLLVWGFLGFLCLSWLLFFATRPARPVLSNSGGTAIKPSGVERATSLIFRRYDRLPRAVYLHDRLVAQPSFLYLLLLALIPLTALAALGAAVVGWTVLAICLLPLGLAFALLWRRGREADAGAVFGSMLAVTGLALLGGTQFFYLKDFLDNSDYYRMNTLFKFFNQVWVLWAILGAIAVPRIFDQWIARAPHTSAAAAQGGAGRTQPAGRPGRIGRWVWIGVFGLLLVASMVYPLLGTPARSDMRMVGWRPPLGTLNGLHFMREGSYAWPDAANVIELRYDYDALQWLLANVRGNATVLESSEVEYYRAWGTKIASNTGLSGLKGMHEQEQRYADEVGYRDGLHRELWASPDAAATQQILDELQVDLIYVGQLEQYLHPAGTAKFAQMAADGLLEVVYQNDRTIIYAAPGFRGLEQAEESSGGDAG